MAVPWAIAARRGQAINRLTATAQAISDKYDIDALPAVASPKNGQDPAVSQMVQIEAFATWLDTLAAKLGITASDTGDYGAMTKDELSAQAEKRGIKRGANATSADYVNALTAQDTAIDARNYGALSVPELTALAARRNVALGTAKLKDDIIAVLVAADAQPAPTPAVKPVVQQTVTPPPVKA